MPSTDQADREQAWHRPPLTTCYSSLFKCFLVSFNFNLFYSIFTAASGRRPYCGRQPSCPAVPAAILNARSSRSHHCCPTTAILGGRTAADGRTVDGLGQPPRPPEKSPRFRLRRAVAGHLKMTGCLRARCRRSSRRNPRQQRL